MTCLGAPIGAEIFKFELLIGSLQFGKLQIHFQRSLDSSFVMKALSHQSHHLARLLRIIGQLLSEW